MAGKVASGGGKKGPVPTSDPNVIPFIDIMLVMLIIFMVAAPPPTVDIKVDLPPPHMELVHNPDDVDKATTVTLVEGGGQRHLYIDSTEVFSTNFDNELLRIVAANNPTKASDLTKLLVSSKIYVDADQSTAYENVIDLINEIDQTGFKKVSLLVKSSEG